MAIVIDASVAIAWRLRDQDGTPFADAVVERITVEEAIVPDLFWHEVRSVLLREERNRRIEAGATEGHMQAIRLLPLSTDSNQDDGQSPRWPAATASAATTRRTWRPRCAAARSSPRSTGSSRPPRRPARAPPSAPADRGRRLVRCS